jgi:hypothetical protein
VRIIIIMALLGCGWPSVIGLPGPRTLVAHGVLNCPRRIPLPIYLPKPALI